MELLCRSSEVIMGEIDNEKKAIIFRNLSRLEFCYNHPKFRNPYIMYQLKSGLKENLNQLGEFSVMNIITAYCYLPKDFSYDL